MPVKPTTQCTLVNTLTLPAGRDLAAIYPPQNEAHAQEYTTSVVPLEVVRVWLDKYDAGTAIGIHPSDGYSTPAVDFDFTSMHNGCGTIDDTLSWDWSSLSTNATILPSDALFQAENLEFKNAKHAVEVTATFSSTLSTAALIYLSKQLSNKVNRSLQPKEFKVFTTDSCSSLTMKFTPPLHALLALRTSVYVDALNTALNAVKDDPDSDLTADWSLPTDGLTGATSTFSI
jgi:hypothetical protein